MSALCPDHSNIKSAKNYLHQDLAGGPVVKMPPFHTGGAGSTPGQETDPTCCMAKEKKKRKKINYTDVFLPVLHHIIF